MKMGVKSMKADNISLISLMKQRLLHEKSITNTYSM